MGQQYTSKEAAVFLGIAPMAVNRAIQRGKLAATRVPIHANQPHLTMNVIEEAELLRYRDEQAGKRGGWHRGYDPEETKRMAEQDYMTVTEGARAIGISATTLGEKIRTGRVPGVVKHVAFIHKDDVARLKRERDEKVAAAQ